MRSIYLPIRLNTFQKFSVVRLVLEDLLEFYTYDEEKRSPIEEVIKIVRQHEAWALDDQRTRQEPYALTNALTGPSQAMRPNDGPCHEGEGPDVP